MFSHLATPYLKSHSKKVSSSPQSAFPHLEIEKSGVAPSKGNRGLQITVV
ncbi:hypothetical protein wcw_1161 [Waddlia chondrophila WSU 86-1044]|uniref:Uncharacterized protein n=1 Tax=Waddlia chondrophila (strain ATCC VR-1470 / WSU 86-1044) TaxID=716544 RepID=D6YWK7_WADCW|nr:hypothetical protein wcw_1161 [Waddlia chondrophila WSU 86-1044]